MKKRIIHITELPFSHALDGSGNHCEIHPVVGQPALGVEPASVLNIFLGRHSANDDKVH